MDLGPCLLAGFGISGVEPSTSSVKGLVSFVIVRLDLLFWTLPRYECILKI